MRVLSLWLAVDKNGDEIATDSGCSLHRSKHGLYWSSYDDALIYLPKGTIKKLTGRELTWEDEPVRLTEDMLL